MTPILAVGGGVVGDLAGFVAATYMRGVPLIHLPTTLLAQVDSSIGGKVAVNHGQLKNNIGTFYQPTAVITDTFTLRTLPEPEYINGMAEVIKYGIIRDRRLFNLVKYSPQLLEEIIERCAAIKAEIVENDERDLGLRNILNYGHTVGHALETVSNYDIKHGQGVAIGMIAAALISQRMGYLSEDDFTNIQTLIGEIGLPVIIQGLGIPEIMQVMQHDKKKKDGKIRFILPRAIGDVFISEDVSQEMVEQVLKDLHD
jgi:3-dehydroquinate synthase